MFEIILPCTTGTTDVRKNSLCDTSVCLMLSVNELQTWHLYEENRLPACFQATLNTSMLSSYSEQEVLRIIHVALLCTQETPSQRPSMSRVVSMLSGVIETHPPQSRPGYITDWQFLKQNANNRSINNNENSWSWNMSLTLEERSL
jgi:hypothetical protein